MLHAADVSPADLALLQASPPAVDGPVVVVLNSGSGHQDARRTRELIEQQLAAAGREHHLALIERGDAVAEVARRAVRQAQSLGGVVVAAGGDGTINAVAQAALGSGCAFGVLPQGTFNYFGRTHGIPEDTAQAVAVLLGGRPQPVQVGLVNDDRESRVFLVNASLGLYPKLLEDREAYKSQWGRSRLVALAAGVMSLMREHRQLALRIGWSQTPGRPAVPERRLRTPTLFVANNRLQLEQIGIADAPALDQGQLVGIALKPVGSLAMLGLLLRGALGRLGDADQVLSLPFLDLSVRQGLRYGLRRLKVATDGEVMWLRSPLRFGVAAQPLWLIKPPPP